MGKPKVIKKERVKTIRRSSNKTCKKTNMTSVMTMDSHTDNHSELSVDTVNNNNLTKIPSHRHSILKLESREDDDDYGWNPVDDDSAGDESFQKGSARRKCSSVSKGISIEEFLRRQDRPRQLSGIDKLIVKNKIALQNLLTKRTRSKLPPAASAPATKTTTTANSDKSKEPTRINKLLWWRIRTTRKRASIGPVPAARKKYGGPLSPEMKTAPAKKAATLAPIEVTETAEIEARRTRSMEGRKPTTKETPDADDKQIRTRSSTKLVELRTASPSPQPRKYNLRSANATLDSSTFDTSANVSKLSTPFKRSIKQEPRDNDCGVARKRRKTEKIETPVTSTVADSEPKPITTETDPEHSSTPVTMPFLVKQKTKKKGRKTEKKESPATPIAADSDPKPITTETDLEHSSTPVTMPFLVKQKTTKRRKTEKNESPATSTAADSDPKSIPTETDLERSPTPIRFPFSVEKKTEMTACLEAKPIVNKKQILEPKRTVEEIQVVLEQPSIIDPEPTLSTEMMVDKAPVIEKDYLTKDPIIDEIEPPTLSPQAPLFTKANEDIAINSSKDSDIQLINNSPPVKSPSVPAPTLAKDPPEIETAPAKLHELLSKQPNTKVEDKQKKKTAKVSILGSLRLKPLEKNNNYEPVGSACEKTTPVFKEPEVIPSQENQPKQPDTKVQDKQEKKTVKVSILGSPGLNPLEKNNNYEPVGSTYEKISPVVEEPEVTSSRENQPKEPDTKVQDGQKKETATVSILGMLRLESSEKVQQKSNYEPVGSAREKTTPVFKLPDTRIPDRQENAAGKELILGALGLAPLEKVQQEVKEKNNRTNTLRSGLKTNKEYRPMDQKLKQARPSIEGLQNETVLSFYSKMMPNKFPPVDSAPLEKRVSKRRPVNRLYSPAYKNKCLNGANVRAMETDRKGMIDPLSSLAKEKIKTVASLVVPKKNCSYSIHSNRQCSDICKYCYRNFGSLDKPWHVGRMKNPERQRKILLFEPKLQLDTCLCEACYRFVDQKANESPQEREQNMKRSISMDQPTMGPCVIQKCTQVAKHIVKRKELLLISKKVAKLSFSINTGGPRKQYGLCSQHHHLMDLYTMCGICKKRLNCYQMYSIGSELNHLNNFLQHDDFPITLDSNMLLCKSCDNFMSMLLKYDNSSYMSPGDKEYYQNFRKKVLIDYNVAASDSEDDITAECLRYEKSGGIDLLCSESSLDTEMFEEPAAASPFKTPTANATTWATCSFDSRRPSNSSSSSKTDNHSTSFRDIADFLKDGDKTSSPRIQVKFGNLNIGKLNNLNINQNASTSQSEPECGKSGDREVPLVADFCFKTPDESSKNLEECDSTTQFDKETKKLWQDLQKPYDNQSSFVRHLIMLEKYWRSGALGLTGKADTEAIKYINSVENRIQSETFSPSPTPAPSSASIPAPTAVSSVVTKTSQNFVKNTSSTIHYKPNGADKTSPVQAGSSFVNLRHIRASPMLLKIGQTNGTPVAVSKKTIVSSGSKVQLQTSAPKLFTPRIANIPLQQYVKMMKSQPRTKYLAQVTDRTGKKINIPLNKPLPTMVTVKPCHIISNASAKPLATLATPIVAKKSASLVYQGTANLPKPNDIPKCNINAPQLPAIATASTAGA